VVHILSQAIAVLQGKADATNNPHGFTKREALFLVAHLTGDIHQPLHVGAVYLDSNDEFVDPKSEIDVKSGKAAETHGGNWLMLGSHNLHSLWDTDLVHRAMRREHVTTPKEFADALLAKGFPKPADHGHPDAWPKKWADESMKLSKADRDRDPGGTHRRRGQGRVAFGLVDLAPSHLHAEGYGAGGEATLSRGIPDGGDTEGGVALSTTIWLEITSSKTE
jgi:hypothetical protein